MLISRDSINQIQELNYDHSVSIFIRTHRAGESKADRIRWKNGCSEAAEKLIDRGLDGALVRKILSPATALLDDLDFWQQLSDGLCMFLSDSYSKMYILPIEFENKVFVTDNFITSPLYLYFKGLQRFFIYDISKGHNRFFEANRDSITPVVINDLVPSSIEEMPELDDLQSNIQQHGENMYHGHGASSDNEEIKISKYIKALSEGMREIFKGESVPLVLSGPEEIVSMFRQTNNYEQTVDDYIHGSNEDMDPVELHEHAWNCIQNYTAEHNITDSDNVRNQSRKNLIITDLKEIDNTIKRKNISKLILNENFQKYDDNKFMELNALVKSASFSGAEIEFAEQDTMDELMLEVFAFKYY